MKLLEITPEIEQALIAAFDAALKAGGMSLLSHIEKVIANIKEHPEQPKAPS